MFIEGVDWPFSTLDSMLSEQPARSATSFKRNPRPRRRYLMRKPSAVWRSRSADLVSVEVEVISMFGRALFQWKATAAQSAPCLGYRRSSAILLIRVQRTGRREKRSRQAVNL